jgi:hypothetical protein
MMSNQHALFLSQQQQQQQQQHRQQQQQQMQPSLMQSSLAAIPMQSQSDMAAASMLGHPFPPPSIHAGLHHQPIASSSNNSSSTNISMTAGGAGGATANTVTASIDNPPGYPSSTSSSSRTPAMTYRHTSTSTSATCSNDSSTSNSSNIGANNRKRKADADGNGSIFPVVLYNENDGGILGEYQTLLRQQLELFEADGHDVINGTFRQGRSTPIQLGQIGLRCKHCATSPLAVRTKGSVYCKYYIYYTKQHGHQSNVYLLFAALSLLRLVFSFSFHLHYQNGRSSHCVFCRTMYCIALCYHIIITIVVVESSNLYHDIHLILFCFKKSYATVSQTIKGMYQIAQNMSKVRIAP